MTVRHQEETIVERLFESFIPRGLLDRKSSMSDWGNCSTLPHLNCFLTFAERSRLHRRNPTTLAIRKNGFGHITCPSPCHLIVTTKFKIISKLSQINSSEVSTLHLEVG